MNYVNAHATSTLAGDLAEVNAIKKVFKDTSELKMNATKVRNIFFSFKYFRILTAFFCQPWSYHYIFLSFQSMIGHGLGAAGGLEAIATIKAITTGWLHPTINQDVTSWTRNSS